MKSGFPCRPLPISSWQGKRNICCLGVMKGQTTFDAKIASTWLEQPAQQLYSCTYFRGHSREVFSSLADPSFKMCSKTIKGLRTGRVWSRDRYLHSRGVFKDAVPWRWRTEALCPQGLFPRVFQKDKKLTRSSAWALACDVAFCAGLQLSLLILGGVSFIKSLGTSSH